MSGDLDGTPVRCLKLLNESTGSHLVELDSGKTLAVAGKNLVPAEDHSEEINCVVLRVLPNADFLKILRALELLRGPLPRPKQTHEFTEREEKRTIMAVLKQNLAMGVITQDEYDHLANVNEQTLSPEPAEEVTGSQRARQMLKVGSSWVKKTAEKLKMSPAPSDGALSRANWESVKPLPMAPLSPFESDDDTDDGGDNEDGVTEQAAPAAAGLTAVVAPESDAISPAETHGPSEACEKTPAYHISATILEAIPTSEAKKKKERKARRRVIDMDD